MPETLWDGGPILHQAPGVFPMGTDSILLADFARPGKRDRILDLGTGSGILAVLLLSMAPAATASAVELSPEACKLAQTNFQCNGLSDRARLIPGDLRQYRDLIPAGAFDLAVSNPPYFETGTGYDASFGLRDARGDGTCTLEDLCTAAGWATRWGGRFCVVFRPERLCSLFVALKSAGLEPKRLRPVQETAGAAPWLFLLECRKGGRPGLQWEAPLCRYVAYREESAEWRKIYNE